MGLTVLFTKSLKSISWSKTLGCLGFKKPLLRQLAIGFLSLVPIFFCDFFIAPKTGLVSFRQVPTIALIKFVFMAGLFEESFFRGFLFQFLRSGRSFFGASILSGLLWSAYHIGRYVPGAGPFYLRPILVPMFTSFVLAFPAAFLFERGGNVLWGFMVMHLGIDVISSTASVHSSFFAPSNIWKVAGLVLSALAAWGLTCWWLPAPGAKGLDPPTETEILGQNEVSARWSRYLTPVLLIMAVLLFLCPAMESQLKARSMAEHPNVGLIQK